MKILISARRFGPPFIGGADVYAQRLGQAFGEEGHDVAYIGFVNTDAVDGGEIELKQNKYKGNPVWQLNFSLSSRPATTFIYAYDEQVGGYIKSILLEEQPDLFVILNFYLLTFSAVQIAHELHIPMVHIATDFIPVCRRATLMQWDHSPCQSGESIKACATCFVSHRSIGRIAAGVLNRFQEETLIQLANGHPRNPALKLLAPYWNQVRLMNARIAMLEPLKKKVDLVLAPTQFTVEAFIKNGFEPGQVQLLPFGVEPDNSLASVQSSPADHVRFLFVGRFQPYKGLHLLIQAFKALNPHHGATLTIVGGPDPDYQAYYNRLIASADNHERINFAGIVPFSGLGRVFAEADYFVLPSTWHENSPLILLDSLQSRTPVIASAIGGVQDLIQDGVNGRLFRMGDANALQQVMQEVILRPELIDQFRQAINLPTIQEYAGRVLELSNAIR